MKMITDYKLTEMGEMTVLQKTKEFYQSLDFTAFAEFLFDCIEETIEHDFKDELLYIQNYDKMKTAIQDVIDMPDQKIDLLIKFLIQNDGKLSERKRKNFFSMLTNDEIGQIERSMVGFVKD